MNYNESTSIYLIGAAGIVLCICWIFFVLIRASRRRRLILKRLQGADHNGNSLKNQQESPMQRNDGNFEKWLAALIPQKALGLINHKLNMAGRPWGMGASSFLAIAAATAVSIGLLVWLVLEELGIPTARSMLLSVSFMALTVYLPWFVLARKVTFRQKEIRKRLPDVMDLLIVSVEAGLSLEMALVKVSNKLKGPLGAEFRRVLKEMQLGRPRKDSFMEMAKRVNLPEFTAFVKSVLQAEQLGVGMGHVLRMQSDLMRERRQRWIEEQAMKLPVKMIVPLVFLVFPSVFIIILGPAILSVIKVFGGS